MPVTIKCLSSTYCCGFRVESVPSNDTEEFWSVLAELQPGRARLYQHLMSLATVRLGNKDSRPPGGYQGAQAPANQALCSFFWFDENLEEAAPLCSSWRRCTLRGHCYCLYHPEVLEHRTWSQSETDTFVPNEDMNCLLRTPDGATPVHQASLAVGK